jgi:hypothetical protein
MRKRPADRRCAVGLIVMALLATGASRAVGYGLALTPRGDTVQHVAPSGDAEFHFTLTNAGTSSDVYELSCRVVSAVPGWAAVYCVRGVCVEPGVLRYDTIPAGDNDTTPKITVYTNVTEGEEVVSLRVRSMGDTTLAESIATHTIAGLGVEELPGRSAPVAGLSVTPSLVHRQSGASVKFSTPGQVFFRVTLRDAAGRLVQAVAGGVLPAGRHRIIWLPERELPGGVYLLCLSAGDESAVTKVIVE